MDQRMATGSPAAGRVGDGNGYYEAWSEHFSNH